MPAPATPESLLAQGFVDPVHDTQETFRALLTAMSRPGQVMDLPALPASGGRLAPETLAVLMALADLDTPVWMRPGLADGSDLAFVRFHCGCPAVRDAAVARFAVVGADAGTDELGSLCVGSVEYPDRSATVVVQVGALDNGTDETGGNGGVILRGPGIDGEARLNVAGPGPGFWDFVRENTALFPLGLDFIFVARGRAACLPRSITVET